MSQYNDLIDLAKHTTLEAAHIILSKSDELKNIESTVLSGKETKIKADEVLEDLIIRKLENTGITILSEESGYVNTNNSNLIWIIDPLDGTTNFAHNLPIFAVSIGLVKNMRQTISGVVYNPAADKCFYAEAQKGAYLNGRIISPSNTNSLSDSLIATGFPYLHDKKYDLSFKIFKDFYDSTHGIRRLGAAALDLCFVAMGRFDGFYEYSLNSWDICAGSLIAHEAGCKVSDWDGKMLPHNGDRILCSNEKIHNDMVSILTKDEYEIFF